jgi:WD40 repeat protein
MPPRTALTHHLLFAALAAACLVHTTRAADVKIGPASAAVLTPDSKTVIVAVPDEGAILYFDAETEKQVKKVELDFQPNALAVQGKSLFASTKGSGTIHVLDPETGKEAREIKIPGEPIRSLACHPTKGLLYATNRSNEVYAVDPGNGKVTKTKARGQMIVVDQSEGKFVYTGVQSPISDHLVVEEGPDNRVRVSLATANERALMLKFAAEGADLKLVAYQDNAALNGKALALSADGKRIAMAGGGGWVSRTDGRYNYGIAVFETSDLKTMAGEVGCGAYPYSVSFHPVLNMGVAVKGGNDLIVFNGKSLARKELIKAPRGEPGLILYAAQGTKLVQLVNSGVDSVVSFHPLKLSEQDREILKAAYRGK